MSFLEEAEMEISIHQKMETEIYIHQKDGAAIDKHWRAAQSQLGWGGLPIEVKNREWLFELMEGSLDVVFMFVLAYMHK